VFHSAGGVFAVSDVTAPSSWSAACSTGRAIGSEPSAENGFAPYWRPAAFATAIVVADALVWEAADASILPALTTSMTSRSTRCAP
jgi:hypothetical protein